MARSCALGFSRFTWPYARSNVRQFLYTAKRIRAGADMVLVCISLRSDPWDVGTGVRRPKQYTALHAAGTNIMAVAACRTYKSWEERCRSRLAFGEWALHGRFEEFRSDVSSSLGTE